MQWTLGTSTRRCTARASACRARAGAPARCRPIRWWMPTRLVTQGYLEARKGSGFYVRERSLSPRRRYGGAAGGSALAVRNCCWRMRRRAARAWASLRRQTGWMPRNCERAPAVETPGRWLQRPALRLRPAAPAAAAPEARSTSRGRADRADHRHHPCAGSGCCARSWRPAMPCWCSAQLVRCTGDAGRIRHRHVQRALHRKAETWPCWSGWRSASPAPADPELGGAEPDKFAVTHDGAAHRRHRRTS